MASHLYRDEALCAACGIRRQSALGVDRIDADSGEMDAGSKLDVARRYDSGYEEEAPTATAALFAGLLLGAGSTALMFGLATLIL